MKSKKLTLKPWVEKTLALLVFGFIGFVTMTVEVGADNLKYMISIVTGSAICYGIIRILKKYGKDWE